MRSVKEMQSNTALGSITFPPHQALLIFSLAMAEVATVAAECHALDSQGRQRGWPATTGATCPGTWLLAQVLWALAPVLCHPSCHCWGHLGSCPHQHRALLCQDQAFPTATTTKCHLAQENSQEKDIFMSAPPQHIIPGQVKEEIINTTWFWLLKRETGDFHRWRRNLIFCKYLFLLDGYSQ